MKIIQRRANIICCECTEVKDGIKIIYFNDSPLTYLCNDCTSRLTKMLNDHSADEWLKNETN
jgi:predicted nucleic acid-binding Zn ribbon protein